jgi:uncharacterized membrane protein
MHFETSIDIDAPRERVWAVMTDVERWPEWTSSIVTLRRLDEGPLRTGSRARIRQPGLFPTVWRVTDLEPGMRFTWISTSPGLRVTASHTIEPASRSVRVTLAVQYDGLFGGLMGRMTRNLTNRYLRLEAEGLKRRSEGPA